MKKTLLTLTLASSACLLGSQISDDLAYTASLGTKNIVQEKNIEEKNIGHITFKVGLTKARNADLSLIPTFMIGYQSKLDDSSLFQSSSIEFGGGYAQKTLNNDEEEDFINEGVIYYPKMMAIHYWNRHSENRYFTSIGSNLSTLYKIERKKTVESSDSEDDAVSNKYYYSDVVTTALGISAAAGIEMGKPSGAINILKIELDQPAVEVFSVGGFDFATRLSLSYTVGF